ncbi:hypothetical protein CTEN210_11873 [Chaetoceros tenuissimus]|uniref:Uncharacterized protein n=1 Tax=Chaetoceros tenuissimus TaxID=426638 RepID=A0AAD3H9B2_9STRA|nr:hypothetical protein CTEN210_11873 [Chaetoceros tenuissimus]
MNTPTISRLRHIANYSPPKSPKTWLFINITCAIWSILLFIEILYTLGPLERLEGTREYLIYSFGTTIVWVIEVTFTCIHHQSILLTSDDTNSSSNTSYLIFRMIYFQTREDYEIWVELILAVYFLFDSMDSFVQWKKADLDVTSQGLDAFVNFAGYIYEMYKIQRDTPQRICSSFWKNERDQHGYRDVDDYIVSHRNDARKSDAVDDDDSSSMVCIV